MNNNFNSMHEEGLIGSGSACPRCWHIFYPAQQNSSTVQCPNCKHIDENFNTFPHPAAIDILKSLQELKKTANQKRNTRIKEIIHKLQEEFGTTYDQGQVNQLIIDLDRAYNECSTKFPDKKSRLIGNRLNIREEDSIEVAYKIISGNHTIPEYKPMILLSASLIEILFKNFIYAYISASLNNEKAYKLLKLVKENNTRENIELINCFLESSLDKEMKKIDPKFYHQWAALRKNQNEIIHNNIFTITSSYAENVYKLAMQSISVFAGLNNNLISSR